MNETDVIEFMKAAGKMSLNIFDRFQPSTSSPQTMNLPTDLHLALNDPTKSREELLGRDCVVCGAANSGFHFGCIACAACSAFFRRSVVLKRNYFCRRDPSNKTRCPLDRRHRSNCRACRFIRCIEMGMNPSGVQNLRDIIKQPKIPKIDEEMEDEEEEEGVKREKYDDPLASNTPGSWISNISMEHNSPAPKCGDHNLIDLLTGVYKNSVERRRMYYCNGSLREILNGSGLTMRPTKFNERYYKDKMRFELILYLEMMNTMTIFRNLDIDTKEALVKNCAVSLALLEKYYVSIKNDGLKANRLIAPDGSYTDFNDNGAQFINDAFNERVMDKDTCMKLLYDPLRSVLQDLGSALEHSKMSDVEFCALFAVLLFNTAADNLSETSRESVLAARNRVIKDWFEYYEKQGIPSDQASMFVGNTLLLLTPVRNALAVHRENFHVIRVFNVMEYDKLIDDLAFT